MQKERDLFLKSFFIPIGKTAGISLPTVLAAMSCGATLPVLHLDILHITDCEPDPLLPPLIRDINQAHKLLCSNENTSLFPSSFSFETFRPHFPSVGSLSADASSSALLNALRGNGIPLSYKTDREAVEWAFSSLLYDKENKSVSPFLSWISRIHDCLSCGEQFRIAVCCDLCDPFSAGVAFVITRYLSETVKADPSCVALFCLGIGTDSSAVFRTDMLSASLQALVAQNLVARPNQDSVACSDAAWLLALPSALVHSDESYRLLYPVLARQIAVYFSAKIRSDPRLPRLLYSSSGTAFSFLQYTKRFVSPALSWRTSCCGCP